MSAEDQVKIAGYPWYTITRDGTVRSAKGRILIPSKAKYPSVGLTRLDPGTRETVAVREAVHRLVAATFLENPENKPFVNHKNGDTKNYHADNLEWCTGSENQRHALQTGLRKRSHRHPAKFFPIEGERWLPIADCDSTDLSYIEYEVSDLGRVRNSKKKYLMTQHGHANGYLVVSLTIEMQRSKSFLVHRLIAWAFLPIPKNTAKLDVNHRDSDKTNNNASNLEWLTREEHAIFTHAKPVTQTTLDGAIVATYPSYKSAGNAVGRTKLSILNAVKGYTSHCAGFLWKHSEPQRLALKQDRLPTKVPSQDVEELIEELLGG